MKSVSFSYISSFCLSLHLATKAGIPLSEGVLLFANDEVDTALRQTLETAGKDLEIGMPLYEVLRNTELFPSYMVDTIEAGERTGKLEDVLISLSDYYDRQESLRISIKNAILYPSMLLAVIAIVTVVFFVQVLPIFHDVYSQLGAQMGGTATAMLEVGFFMRENSIILWGLVALLAIFVGYVLTSDTRRSKAARSLGRLLGGTEHEVAMSSARFTSVMSMALSSGMDVDESLDMAYNLIDDATMKSKIDACRDKLAEGEGFGTALAKSEILPLLYTRMVAVGVRTGTMDTVMAEIARRSADEAETRIESIVSKVEPALVIVMSLLVGLILVSVMLPLASIMSTL